TTEALRRDFPHGRRDLRRRLPAPGRVFWKREKDSRTLPRISRRPRRRTPEIRLAAGAGALGGARQSASQHAARRDESQSAAFNRARRRRRRPFRRMLRALRRVAENATHALRQDEL